MFTEYDSKIGGANERERERESKRLRRFVKFLFSFFFFTTFFFGIPTSVYAASFSFTKYSGNPIVQVGSSGNWDANWVLDPDVIKESDGTYKMWYLGFTSSWVPAIGYATSSDGINWTKYGSNPVMNRGAAGSYDYNLWEARVIKDGDTYKMWYQSAADGSSVYKTNYATSSDGISWTKYSGNPIFSGTTGKWDQDYAGFRSIIKDGSTYRAWYEANKGSAKFAVGYATSTDGISWTKVSTDAPVLQGDSGAWDDANLVPNVIKVNDKFVMFYSTRTGTAKIGIATSTDGQNWTKYSGNSVFDMLGASGTWDSLSGTTLVSVIQDSTSPQNFLLYYRGLKSVYQIGLINLQVAVPSSSSLSSPTNFTKDNTKPTLTFKKSTGSASGVTSYTVSLDSGKNRSFSTSGIPSSGNGSSDYVWKDDSSVKVEFLNENDSDSSNDEIHVYFKDLDKTELSEGKHTWTVTAYDDVFSSTAQSSDFYLDKTSPSISELAIANVSTVLSGVSYNLDITNRMPSFSGLSADSYQGSTVTNSNGTKDTFDKVSSGPQTLTLTFKKQKSDKTYADYSTKDFSLSDIQDINGDKKSTRFYITTPFPLVDGYYQVTIVLKDSAGNSYSQPVFYLSLNQSIKDSSTELSNKSEAEITDEKKLPGETQEEKIKKEGYIVKIKVVDPQNKPVAGAKVTIHSKTQETTTNKSGIALFNSVEPGQHKILIAYENYKGEQNINLTGDIKEFNFNIQVKQANAFLNPQVMIFVGIMGLAIIVLVILLIKNKRKV